MISSQSVHVTVNDIISIIMAEYYSILCMYHFFFIHSSISVHTGCFSVLVIVSSAAMNFRVHIPFEIKVFLGLCPGVEFLDHMIILCLIF